MRFAGRFSSALAFIVGVLPASAAIRGTLINTDGAPIVNATVRLVPNESTEVQIARWGSPNPGRETIASTTTDEKGFFTLDAKKVLNSEITFDAFGYEPESLRVNPDEEIIVALRPAAMISSVVSAGGKAVANATVIITSRSGAELLLKTAEEGRYSVPDPDVWADRRIVVHDGYAPYIEGPALRGTFRKPVTLEQGTTIRGKALSADGKSAIAGATVIVDHVPYGLTRDDGTFVVTRVPSGWTMLQIVRGDLAGARTRRAKDEYQIKLTKAVAIKGTVREGKSQKALAGARVTLTPRDSFGRGASRIVFADPKGNFSFSTLTPGRYSLTAAMPGFIFTPVEFSTAARSTSQTLAGTAAAAISGFVLDENQKPVAGTIVRSEEAGGGRMRFERMMAPDSPQSTYSAPDGRFILRSIQPDQSFELQARKKGFPVATSESIKLAPGEKKSGVTIVIPRGVELVGQVIDHQGKPIAGASVQAAESEDSGPGGRMRIMRGLREDDESVKTSKEGAFSLRVKEGRHDISVRASGFAAKRVRAQTVTARTPPIEIIMEPGAALHGRVIRADGIGVPDVMINVMGAERSLEPVLTGADGSFTVSDLAPGQSMLLAVKPDAFIQEMRSVTVPGEIEIKLELSGRIEGRVVDKSSRQPLTSFQVAASPESREGGPIQVRLAGRGMKGFETEDGTFVLEVKPGSIDLRVEAPGYLAGRVSALKVEPGKALTDVVVELETGVRVSGNVTGPDGAPLAGVSVRADTADGGAVPPMLQGLIERANATTDANGEYVIDAVAPGEMTFVFRRDGYITERKTSKLSGKESRLDAKLSKGLEVRGTVITEEGMPVADAGVSASSSNQDAQTGASVRTDQNGAFRFEGLAPGRYRFQATQQGLTRGEVRDHDISSNAPIRIVLQNGGVISGRVAGLAERDLAQASVRASSGSQSKSAAIDSSGNFRVEGVPAGTARVTASAGSFPSMRSSSSKTVEVTAGSEVQVDLEFKSDVVIRGRVTRNGEAVSGAMVIFSPKTVGVVSRASAQTDSSGSYEVTGLEPASYNVSIADMQRNNGYERSYDVSGSATFDIDIRGATLRGRVVDASTSDPIPDAGVSLQRSDSRQLFGVGAVTKQDGSFQLDSIGDGTYRLRAEKAGYGAQLVEVTLAEGGTEERELRLQRSDGVVLEIVDGRDGRSLSSSVTIRDLQGRSLFEGFPRPNAEGQVRISLAAGQYRATISASGYAPRIVPVQAPSQGLRIGLTPGGSIIIESNSSSRQRAKLLTSSGEEYPRGGRMRSLEIAIDPGTTTLDFIAPGSYNLQLLEEPGGVRKTIPLNVNEGVATRVEL